VAGSRHVEGEAELVIARPGRHCRKTVVLSATEVSVERRLLVERASHRRDEEAFDLLRRPVDEGLRHPVETRVQ
jgi:hypothetical protein